MRVARTGCGMTSSCEFSDDGRGWLWMSSNRGVFRVRRDALMAFFDGRSERVSCEGF